MTVEELKERWLWKMVRTEDPTRHNCGAPKFLAAGTSCGHTECGPDDVFGGEGEAIDFREEDGKIWMTVDWGYAWVIDEGTTIVEVGP